MRLIRPRVKVRHWGIWIGVGFGVASGSFVLAAVIILGWAIGGLVKLATPKI